MFHTKYIDKYIYHICINLLILNLFSIKINCKMKCFIMYLHIYRERDRIFSTFYHVASVYTNFQIVTVNVKGNLFMRETRTAKFSIKTVGIPSAVASKALALVGAGMRKRKGNKDAVFIKNPNDSLISVITGPCLARS